MAPAGAASLLACAALAGCGPGRQPAAVGPDPVADAGFVAPPSVSAAVRLPGGRVRLEGRAPADSLVRLLSPEAGAVGVAADGRGRWVLELPAAAAPRLFALSAEVGGRTLRAEGAVAVAPAPGAVALTLRGGSAAWPAAVPFTDAVVRLAAVDFDGGGGVGAAGYAAAGAEVRLLVDGAATGEGRADARGRFALLAVRAPLTPGVHVVRVATRAGAAEASVTTGGAPQLGDRPYAAQRVPGGWRIDWSPPGGGSQSVVALDLAGGA